MPAHPLTLPSMLNAHVRYAIVTPVRDEARFIEETVASVASQLTLPLQWIIVDDGSTDGTGDVIEAAAARFPWITSLHRNNRGYRAAGTGVIEAFYAGYAALDVDWEYIIKLDGDLKFGQEYFTRCFEEFERDERLGIGGGLVCRDDASLTVDSPGDPRFHVRGATKIYRRSCWEAISPLPQCPGWDTVDEIKANRLGWTTRTFVDLPLIQQKATGHADGRLRNWFKNGRANYLAGYHPLFMLAKCARRAPGPPLLIESAALAAGFFSGYLSRLPRAADGATIAYLQNQQLRRLLLLPSIYG